MKTNEKCPKCGAEVVSYGDAGPCYACGRIGKTQFGFTDTCWSRQLAQKDATIAQLIIERDEAKADCEALKEAALYFGSYAKTLMVDSHVTDEYLNAEDGYRARFLYFEKIVEAKSPSRVSAMFDKIVSKLINDMIECTDTQSNKDNS